MNVFFDLLLLLSLTANVVFYLLLAASARPLAGTWAPVGLWEAVDRYTEAADDNPHPAHPPTIDGTAVRL